MMGAIVAVGVTAMALIGCAASPPPPEEPPIDLAAEEQAARAVNVKWLELARAKDAEGVGALFVADGWTLSSTEGLTEGRAAIVASGKKDFEENPDQVVDWGAKQVWVAASGDLAVERGWWTVDEDGEGEGEATRGEYTTVLTKVGDEWKVLTDSSVTLEGPGEDEEG
jgi:ketosteroid isomerase-like protein